MGMEVIVRYPAFARFGYVEIREDVGSAVDVGPAAERIIESLTTKVKLYASPEPQGKSSGGGKGSGYTPKPRRTGIDVPPDGKWYPAKYDGYCNHCGNNIAKGTDNYVKKEGDTWNRFCKDCVDDEPPF